MHCLRSSLHPASPCFCLPHSPLRSLVSHPPIVCGAAPSAPGTVNQAPARGRSPGQHAEPQDAQSKAAARKARRQPPAVITPGVQAGFTELQQLLNNGALLIDKPLEWTSFDVCGKLRGTLKPWKVKKVGHAGTLDPMATGLLVVCTGSGTKFVDDYQAMEKEYTGVLRLGEGTPSYDAEMEVTEQLPWQHVTDKDLDRVAKQFEGDIMQLPPMYSAIKVKGQKLYDLAREGQTIKREERPVTVMKLQLWRSTGEQAPPTGSGSARAPATAGDRRSNLTQGSDSQAGPTGSVGDTEGGARASRTGESTGPGTSRELSAVGSSGSSSSSSGISNSSSGSESGEAQAQRGVSNRERSDSSGVSGARDGDSSGGQSGGGQEREGGVEGGRGFCREGGADVGPHRPQQDVFFRVRCSKGTYVRSLVYDIGRALGTTAYMVSLRREAIGDLSVQHAWQLLDLVGMLRAVRDQARAEAEQALQGEGGKAS